MMHCVLSLALGVVAVALAGCSESVGERVSRECEGVVDAAADSEDTTNASVATVKRTDMEAVIRSERWATTPLRKAIQAELDELETSRGYTSDKYDAAWNRVVNEGGERDAICAQRSTMTSPAESDSATGRSSSASRSAT